MGKFNQIQMILNAKNCKISKEPSSQSAVLKSGKNKYTFNATKLNQRARCLVVLIKPIWVVTLLKFECISE